MNTLLLQRHFVHIVVVLWTCLVCKVECVPPAFSGLPTSVSVGEQEYENRIIYTLTVTDVNGDSFDCTLDAATLAATDKFLVIRDPITSEFAVYTYNANPVITNVLFDYATQTTYPLTVECTDSNGEVNTGTLTVNVIDNDRLEFTNLPVTLSVDALNTAAGITLYTVQSTDLLNHSPLTYTFTTTPATSSFTLDSGTGALTTAQHLQHEIYNPIDVLVTVTDSIISVRETLRISFTNMNNIPTITNLPATVNVLETVASGTVLFTLTAQDLDTTDTLTYTVNVDPVTDASLFTLDTTTLQLQLSTGRSFNYEQTTKSYNITFLISDSKTSTGPYSLVVNILNDDEACYFQNSLYSVSMNEATIGSYPVDPVFVVNDYDGSSTYTLGFVAGNNSDRFSIDSSTGIINFAVDYDVDQSAMPSTVQLTVQCTDPTSLTGTTILLITINDVNDNSPVFAQGSYSFSVNQNTALGTQLGTLVATDNDSGTNAQYTCSATATNNALATTYYNIGSDCGVYLLSTTGLTENQIITFTVTATDQGSPALTGTTFVSITYVIVTTTTTTTTTTTATTTTVDPLTEPGTIAAIVIGTILGAILLGLLIYFCWRWCYTGACCGPHSCDFMHCCREDCCRPNYQNRPVRQVTPQDRRVVKELPRETAEEFKYRRDDSDLGSVVKKYDNNPRQWPSSGKRDYMDFPQTVTPSDVPLEVSQSRRIIGYTPVINRPQPIGYM